MTLVAFIHSSTTWYNKDAPYSASTLSVIAYKVLDDKKFSKLVEVTYAEKLEETAKIMGVIEEIGSLEGLAQVWGLNGDKLGWKE